MYLPIYCMWQHILHNSIHATHANSLGAKFQAFMKQLLIRCLSTLLHIIQTWVGHKTSTSYSVNRTESRLFMLIQYQLDVNMVPHNNIDLEKIYTDLYIICDVYCMKGYRTRDSTLTVIQ